MTEIKYEDFDTELALKFSKIVHEKCQNVPHNIGILLAREEQNMRKVVITNTAEEKIDYFYSLITTTAERLEHDESIDIDKKIDILSSITDFLSDIEERLRK